MRITVDRSAFAEAFAMVAGVAPGVTTMPILGSLKFEADEDGATLNGTDLEIGVRRRVLGVEVHEPGAAMLSVARFSSILRASDEESISISADDGVILVRDGRSNYSLPSDDPGAFPSAFAFDADAWFVVASADLRRLIRRTVNAVDPKSATYALGGVLVEIPGREIAMVASNGRRLVRASAAVGREGEPGDLKHPGPVLQPKALKLIERNLDDDGPPVSMAFRKSDCVVRSGEVEVVSRLLEGRYPDYRQFLPPPPKARVPMTAGAFRRAVERAGIATSDEVRGVDFHLDPGALRLSSRAACVGSAQVEVEVEYQGPAVDLVLDWRHVVDSLKCLGDDEAITVELIDARTHAVFRAGEEFMSMVAVVIPRGE